MPEHAAPGLTMPCHTEPILPCRDIMCLPCPLFSGEQIVGKIAFLAVVFVRKWSGVKRVLAQSFAACPHRLIYTNISEVVGIKKRLNVSHWLDWFSKHNRFGIVWQFPLRFEGGEDGLALAFSASSPRVAPKAYQAVRAALIACSISAGNARSVWFVFMLQSSRRMAL